MAIIVNTNIPALNIQQTLAGATDKMNQAMLRMSTGSKINSAADDAAGMAVATNMSTQISGSKVAQQNAQLGSNLLSTAEGTLNVINKNLGRIRDLVEQSANGTYDSKAKAAIRTEIGQRCEEIDRLAGSTKFNGISLFDSATNAAGDLGVALQVGADTGANSVITLDKSIFASAVTSDLGLTDTAIDAVLGTGGAGNVPATATQAQIDTLLGECDAAITNVTDRKTNIGAFQNRLSSAIEGLKVSSTNLSSSRSTIQDADIAEESASYVQNQILQQASASLLASANQAPSIAINLV